MAFDWISKCATSRNALRLGLLSCILWPLLVLAENWSYQGNTGPRHWGRLHKEFKLCLHGQQQSPIDIHTKTAKHANDNLIFHYAAANFSKNAVGDKLFTLSNARNYVLFNNEQFFLESIQMRTPSEHEIDDKQREMEVQLLHKNHQDQWLIVSVLIKPGHSNVFLTELWHHSVTNKQKYVHLNPFKLIPAKKTHYVYLGSLTTPPCSEGVIWIVMATPLTASPHQIQYFKKNVIKYNARPLQNLNKREIYQSL